MSESGHQFRRYIKRMVGRRIRYSALCECGWHDTIHSTESAAWRAYCQHSEESRDR